MESIERLQDLYDDLVIFSESKVAQIERLQIELQASVDDFRKLLDKSKQNNKSRDSLGTGKITIEQQKYEVNQEFQELSLQIASSLDIDELEAATLVFYAQEDQSPADTSLISTVVHSFHDRRDLLLQNLRIIIQESNDPDEVDEKNRLFFQDILSQILNIREGPPSNGSEFLRKCLRAMEELEQYHLKLGEQIQSRGVLGQTNGWEIYATLDFQKASVFKQHEALAVVVAYLFRGNYTISEDLRKLLEILKRWDRLDLLLVHYMPAFSAAFTQYGSSDRGSTSLQDARSLDKAILQSQTAQTPSALSPFHAVLRLWWITEYSGWSRDSGSPQSLQGIDLDEESRQRIKSVKVALHENALEYLLSICATITHDTWSHPARHELVSLLLTDLGLVTFEGDQTSTFFRTLFMECLEAFSEAWITNLPDSIRQLKNEEDDQRLRYITAMQEGLTSNIERNAVGPLNLEAFLVLISFAFEERPAAAEQFWTDSESNLFGFLQWASKRQTVPRVSAFSEMLCSISEGPDCAAAAHKFLLDESAPTSSKARRTPSMNYQQMLSELELYARKIHERPTSSQLPHLRKVLPTDMNEIESPVMLASYLRLIAHLCRQHGPTRQFLFQYPNLDFAQTLLTLSSGPVPSYLRASVFNTLEALLTYKTTEIASSMWKMIDQWASSGHTAFNPALVQAGQVPAPSLQVLEGTLSSVGGSFDQYDAFLVLLGNLLSPPVDAPQNGQSLPFPEDLGSSYRSAGVSPYIDYVLGQLFAKRLLELPDESQTQQFRFHCLDILAICLETFNESFVVVSSRQMTSNRSSQSPTPTSTYPQRHPLARVMEWLLNEDVNANLLSSANIAADSISGAAFASPLTASLQRSIDVLNLALDLQPTFFDIVRPLLRSSNIGPRVPVSALTCMEDGIMGHSELVSNLCCYAASDNEPLVLKSLTLLEKMSTLRKLNPNPGPDSSSRSKTKRLIDMLGPSASSDLSSLCRSLAAHMQPSIRELEAGPFSPRYVIKDGILSFLKTCLTSQRDLPNIAHLLLGFARIGNTLIVEPGSLLENGAASLNSILDVAHEYPQAETNTCTSWLVHIKAAAMKALQLLWTSPLSSQLTMIELRKYRFLQNQFISQSLVSQSTLFDGYSLLDPEFFFGSAGDALADFLLYRSCLFEYTASEIRSRSHSGFTALQKAALGTVMGKTNGHDGVQVSHVTLLDLFDFADLDTSKIFEMPQLRFFADVDLGSCAAQSSDDAPIQYDLGTVYETLQQRMNQLAAMSEGKPSGEEDQIDQEAQAVIDCLEAENRWSVVEKVRSQALHMWVESVIATLECCPMDPGPKLQFVLRVLQVILPKLDADEVLNTTDLARAADALLDALTQIPAGQIQGRTETTAMGKLFQLFRSSIEGISSPTSTPTLREILYSICTRYLARIAGISDTYKKLRQNAMDCVKSAGTPLISVLSDDGEDGDEALKLSALSLFSMLTSLSRSEKSPYTVDALVRVNVLEILIEPLKHIAPEFQDSEPNDRAILLEVLQARLLLLLQISRTREGSGYLLEAGLLSAVRESMLFRADPDLGIDAENAQALHNYYELVASMLRLLVSTFLTRGLQNEQSQFLMRSFLQDHRPNMVGLFKRFNGVNGKASTESRPVLAEIVNAYTALMAMSGFMEYEDSTPLNGSGTNGFS